ncbi:hypothetical protein DLAC_05689 [Tieghemostelium lacteum]|uniref:CENP-V/GFA domain-containing protein n=1 Tax=Tieghemostelium lacteum TaxID=361077 RepID=A0A151ZGH6_TIELA|nr:hypothetical protein DLAC_05689 [Tieghemostelium lacteum]|eukprot:KYQ93076.1 hypothetical protein DLAC_05689 [Tieghemostelium lacteum]
MSQTKISISLNSGNNNNSNNFIHKEILSNILLVYEFGEKKFNIVLQVYENQDGEIKFQTFDFSEIESSKIKEKKLIGTINTSLEGTLQICYSITHQYNIKHELSSSGSLSIEALNQWCDQVMEKLDIDYINSTTISSNSESISIKSSTSSINSNNSNSSNSSGSNSVQNEIFTKPCIYQVTIDSNMDSSFKPKYHRYIICNIIYIMVDISLSSSSDLTPTETSILEQKRQLSQLSPPHRNIYLAKIKQSETAKLTLSHWILVYQIGSEDSIKRGTCLHVHKEKKVTKFQTFNFDIISGSKNLVNLQKVGSTQKSLEETLEICYQVSKDFEINFLNKNCQTWCHEILQNLNLTDFQHSDNVEPFKDLDITKGTVKCNCSICFKQRNWSFVVKPEQFTLVSGSEYLTDYQFDPKISHHYFCSCCGIKLYLTGYVKEIGDHLCVIVNTIDNLSQKEFSQLSHSVQYLDGLNNDFFNVPKFTSHL